mgnify:CR=1 FL=1
MKSSHRFPLRRQIVWGMRFFTFLTSLAVGAALFILSNQYVRANSLQAAEFNLRLVATSIETSLESADALLNWASIDSTVRRYISQENINGTQTIAAYEAMQEKYYSSTLYSHILRFFVTNENDRHLQFGPLNSSAALNRTSVKQFLTKGYGMQFATDPLLPRLRTLCAQAQPPVTLTVHDEAQGQRLRPQDLEAIPGPLDLWFCGPQGLGDALHAHASGPRPWRLHRESFAMR